MTQDELISVQDEQRTKRAFISFLSTALGNDQTLTSQDAYAVNYPRQYQTIGPNGTDGVEGQPRSNVQRAATVTPGVLLLGLVVLFQLLRT